MENSKNIVMSNKELTKSTTIQECVAGKYTLDEAGQLLGITPRQICRLKIKYKECGIEGLAHQLRGRESNRKIPDNIVKNIASIIRDKYWDFNPTFARKKLIEDHNIVYSVETIRHIMVDNDIWIVKPRKDNTEHREWRERKEHKGEMIQYDGSYHKWFEDRLYTEKLPCLLASIDDAAKEIMYAKFDTDEGVIPTMKFWTEYSLINGKPLVIYLDRHSTYKKNNLNQYRILSKEEELTQFGRACDECGIKLLNAKSPQGKGRVERLFGTLQNRLLREMRLANINTIEDANEFLINVFIPKFNEEFGVKPKKKANYHKILTNKQKKGLKDIFCIKDTRVITNDFTVQHDNKYYQILKEQKHMILRKSKVIVKTHLDGSVELEQKRCNLNYKLLTEKPQPRKRITISEIKNKLKGHVPPRNHPWRKTCPYVRKFKPSTTNVR